MQKRAAELVVGGVAFAVTEVRPDQVLPDFGDFLDVVRALVRAGEIVLLDRPMVAYGARRELGWPALVDTVDDCALIAVADLGIGTRRPEIISIPRVIGPIASVRLMASYAEPVPPLGAITEPTPVRTDFIAFAHLWATPKDPGSEMDPLAYPTAFERQLAEMDPLAYPAEFERQLVVFEIGKMMGEIQSVLFWLWDDAHEGNMGFLPGEGVKIIDLEDDHVRWLYGSPSPAQSATTLVPLMSSFSPSDWKAFRAGYIAKRGAEGERVIDYIQWRDLTGWMQATRREDLAEAARLLSEQLENYA